MHEYEYKEYFKYVFLFSENLISEAVLWLLPYAILVKDTYELIWILRTYQKE